MKTIRLLSLTLDNFKGCRHKALDFGGRSARIYGENAAGKTTLYDGLTWLLFGKDSKGRSDFEIKPLDASGQVADHAAVTSVQAVLDVDGVRVTLRKTFFERWSTKRGHAEATYDGNTSEFFADEVPLKKNEFERRIAELVDEDTFRALTNVAWFCEQLDWRRRRDMLFTVCELPDDKAIMATDPQFDGLADDMGSLCVDDYKRKLQAQRKGVSAERNSIPARIDEQHKLVQSLSGINFADIRAQRDALDREREQKQGELVKLRNNSLIDSKRNDLGAATNDLRALENENEAYRRAQMVPVEDRRPALQSQLAAAQAEADRARRMEKADVDLVERLERDIDRCRKTWDAENKMTFTADTCVTCGQKLPESALTSARAAFAAEREQNKRRAVDESTAHKATKEAALKRIEEYREAAEQAEAGVKRIRVELGAYVPVAAPVVTDMPDYAERAAAINARIAALNQEIAELQGQASERVFTAETEISELKARIGGLDDELAKESLLAISRKREEELRQDAKNNAAILDALDRQLSLCEDFARFKVRYTESSINGKFQLARWKLFAEQVNGGLADCCEATYDGVPYGSLNSGMRINVGMDVISTLSRHFGLSVPLFVDNAESVTALRGIDTQVIRLVVSEHDKELRCEYED